MKVEIPEEIMQVAALVLGIIGGLFGLLIGLFGYGLGGLARASGAGGAGAFQLVSMALPIAGLAGAGMAMVNPVPAGALMLLSALGMLALFGFNFFTAIPCLLIGLGGTLALVAASQEMDPQDSSLDSSSGAPPGGPNPSSNGQRGTTGNLGFKYDVNKWNVLLEVDPEIAAVASELKPFGPAAVAELAYKYLLINDKQYINSMVAQLVEKYRSIQESTREIDQLDALGLNVRLVWRTPWGAIASLKDGRAMALTAAGVEFYQSLEAFHSQTRNRSEGWEELKSQEDRRTFFKANAVILSQLNTQ